MKELPRFDLGQSSGSDDEKAPSSDTKKEPKKDKEKSARTIGSFAKRTLESGSTDSKRSEKTKSIPGAESAQKPKKNEETAFETAGADKKDTSKLKHEILQAELDGRIAGYDAVIESAPSDSPEHVQAAAAKELDSKVKEKASDPGVEHDPIIEAEYARQLAEIEIPEESDVSEYTEVQPGDLPEETGVENAETTDSDDNMAAAATPSQPAAPSQNGAPAAGVGSGQTPPTPPRVPPASPIPPATPPNPPRPPAPPGGLPPVNGGNFAPPPQNPNAAPNTMPAANPNILAPAPNPPNERSKKAGAFLAGGLAGYAVGRGSRKRTEHRLQPETNSLASELDLTRKHLDTRERGLKIAAAEKLREAQAEKQKNPAETNVRPAPKPKPVSEILRQTVMAPEQASANIPPARVEAPFEMPPAIETAQPAEAPLERQKIERKPAPIVEIKPDAALKRAEQLSTPALLRAAEALFIEGTSVRKLYDTNRIDRKGLVAIVQEGLRGGNIANVFKRVELGHERQAERAREFRHDDPGFSTLLGSSTQQNTSPGLSPAPPKTQPLPNTPDSRSLQPLNAKTPLQSTPRSAVNREEEPKSRSKFSPKTAEFKFGAIAAITIAFLILWIILG